MANNIDPEATTILTLRGTPFALINAAKRLTGETTGNKAFLAAVVQLDRLTAELADERDENKRLRDNLRRSQSLLNQLAPLCIQVAEVAGQKDLFE
ncbi:hypothetical protein [Pseudomonas syringae group genomosp. 3]|uniref:Uncharacterized protein n=1 Tax=Pseudomonas syringae pv. coriandricola TaxID=264453 RepID=A0A3M3JVE2_9PSED|nr:hypothetical protein [Pseudomonas syringae group genomosp. 3]RMN13951.1 hypothetical protein ALQ65_200058 [Pseudomonas syringae pv. coriandricola]